MKINYYINLALREMKTNKKKLLSRIKNDKISPQSDPKPSKTNSRMRKQIKEKITTASVDSLSTSKNKDGESNSDIKKEQVESIDFENIDVEKQRFSLRSRNTIKKNFKKPDYTYDSLSDADYKESPKKKKKKISNPKKNTGDNFNKNMIPKQIREYQINSLLNWKNPVESLESTESNEFEYYEFPDLTSVQYEKYAKDLQCILINPPWNSKSNFDFSKFSSINLPYKAMKEGLIFIWVESDQISEIIDYFENQDIKYVENLVWVKLNEKQYEKNPSSINNDPFDIQDLYFDSNSEYFSKSKITLLIFRKFKSNSVRTLELRHQRTGDTVFDFVDQNIQNYKPFEYIYRLIEVLLPKANYVKGDNLKLMEIWSNPGYKRRGWIHFAQK